MPPVRVTGRTAKLAGGTMLVWSAAVGAYVLVEGYRSWTDPHDANRDLAPAAAFALSSASTDTGLVFYDVQIADTVLDQAIRLPPPEKPKVTQRST